MKTPAINTKFINTLPVLLSSSVCAWFVWHFAKEQYFAALILGVIAGGLVDLDNGLTGKAKNVMYAVAAFAVSSLSVSLAFNHPVALAATFTAIAFVFTMLGAAGTRFRTVSFGTLAVAIYTTLSHDPHAPFYQSTVLIIIGTLLYTLFTLLAHILFPHRPVQEATANAYDALADYLDCKADFFDPDEIGELERQQIRLAMANTRVTNTFNLCRNALFYRMRGQHAALLLRRTRHPRAHFFQPYALRNLHPANGTHRFNLSDTAAYPFSGCLMPRICRRAAPRYRLYLSAPPCPRHTRRSRLA